MNDNELLPTRRAVTQTPGSAALTVVIPTYNRAERVAAVVRSILPQLAPGDELVVVDDCSPDNTAELLGAMPGVRLERHPVNLGMVKNWNSCFEFATNDWICFIHDDDVVAEDAVATLRKTYSALSGPAVIGHPWRLSSSHGEYNYRFYAPGINAAKAATSVCPSGAVIHRAIYKDLGGFNERFLYSADVEYFARLATRYDLVMVDSPAVVTYQLHDSNYQYETWMEPEFWPQWEEISHCFFSYAGLDGTALFYAHREHMVGTLRAILESAEKRKDKEVLRKYGKIAMSKPEYGNNMRIRGLVAATFGRYVQ